MFELFELITFVDADVLFLAKDRFADGRIVPLVFLGLVRIAPEQLIFFFWVERFSLDFVDSSD
jgi:hypothetical protein